MTRRSRTVGRRTRIRPENEPQPTSKAYGTGFGLPPEGAFCGFWCCSGADRALLGVDFWTQMANLAGRGRHHRLVQSHTPHELSLTIVEIGGTMKSNETLRFEVRQQVAENFGADFATMLMDVIPPFDWDRLATKDDLARVIDPLNASIAHLATRQELTELRAEINVRFAEVDGKFFDIRSEIQKSARSMMGTIMMTMITLHATTIASTALLFQLLR